MTIAPEYTGFFPGARLKGLFYFAFWTVLGLLLTGRSYFAYYYYDAPVRLGEAAFWEMTSCYIYALLTPAVFAGLRRYRFDRPDWQLILGIHIALALGFALAHALLLNLCAWLFWPASTAAAGLRESEFLPLLLRNVHFDFLIYWLIAGGGYALELYQRYRERELRAAQLENQLFAAQLQVLKSQIHPHFLFNTLHTVSALMYQDVQLADKMIARLSELLRLTLDNASLQFVNLGRELDFLKLYLEIMKTRYPDRLEISMDISPDTLDAEVPYLILQPLVENAIQHGRTREQKVHEVRISARRERNCLRLEVSDNGPGFPEAARGVFEKGIGLSNTSRRLLQIYGSAQRFILHHKQGGGVMVTLILPYRCKSNQSLKHQGSEDVKDKNPDR